MARFAMAGFLHETNTFSIIPTNYESFARVHGPLTGILTTEVIQPMLGMKGNAGSFGFSAVQKASGNEVYPILNTYTEPSNQIPLEVFDHIVGMITDGISANGPFDGVFLDLHGAMVYEKFQHGEPEIIRRVRKVVGDKPVVASLDLHGNINLEGFTIASALVGCRTYPHIDMYETGERCATLMNYLIENNPFFKAYRQIPFLFPVSTMSTFVEPCKSLYAEIEEVEKDENVLCATIMEGFQAADVPDMGPSVFAYGKTQAAADHAVAHLYEAIMSREGEFQSNLPNGNEGVRQAIQMAAHANRPIILADIQDNAGGGASSDTTGILRELILQGAENAALALMYDPLSAEAAFNAGEGTEIDLELGGKLMPGDTPIRAKWKVIKVFEGDFQGSSPVNVGTPLNLGKMAHLQLGGIHVVVSSHRTQANDRMFFRQVGIEPEKMKILVVKSANHYRADFEPIAESIIPVISPGLCYENPMSIPYKNLREGVRLQGHGPAFKRA